MGQASVQALGQVLDAMGQAGQVILDKSHAVRVYSRQYRIVCGSTGSMWQYRTVQGNTSQRAVQGLQMV